MHNSQRLINHVALVLDRSDSMSGYRHRVPEVADRLIRDLAFASEEKGQETRVSVYSFGSTVDCLIFDMDVMRLPGIADLYQINGMTALVDAVMTSQADLATTSRIYGEHAFLTYVLTDGAENRSRNFNMRDLANFMQTGEIESHLALPRTARSLPNATVAWLVPDRSGRAYVERLGAPRGNVMEWDTNSAGSLDRVGEQIKTATVNFMDGRERGVLRSANVFGTGEENVNAGTVGAAVAARALTPIDPASFVIIENNTTVRAEMADLVRANGYSYVNGTCYYGFWKTENVQPQKNIIIRRRSTGEVYTDTTPSSPAVRVMIGLGTHHTEKVPASANKEFEIFIQSTAKNRKIIPNRTALIMNPVSLRQPASV